MKERHQNSHLIADHPEDEERNEVFEDGAEDDEAVVERSLT